MPEIAIFTVIYLNLILPDKRNYFIYTHGFKPHSGNVTDCGIFIIAMADHLSKNMKFNFTQKDIPDYRSRIAFEIIKNKLFIWVIFNRKKYTTKLYLKRCMYWISKLDLTILKKQGEWGLKKKGEYEVIFFIRESEV